MWKRRILNQLSFLDLAESGRGYWAQFYNFDWNAYAHKPLTFGLSTAKGNLSLYNYARPSSSISYAWPNWQKTFTWSSEGNLEEWHYAAKLSFLQGPTVNELKLIRKLGHNCTETKLAMYIEYLSFWMYYISLVLRPLTLWTDLNLTILLRVSTMAV